MKPKPKRRYNRRSVKSGNKDSIATLMSEDCTPSNQEKFEEVHQIVNVRTDRLTRIKHRRYGDCVQNIQIATACNTWT